MIKKNLVNLITHWCPSNILSRNGNAKKFCLIILNQPINHVDAFNRLWNNGKIEGKLKMPNTEKLNFSINYYSNLQICC
jgi:hypothetical protein